jgi:hypothetical protein
MRLSAVLVPMRVANWVMAQTTAELLPLYGQTLNDQLRWQRALTIHAE